MGSRATCTQLWEEAEAAYAASQQPSAPAYAPPTPPAPSSTADLDHLVQLHASGALNDQEFAVAKAQLLGL